MTDLHKLDEIPVVTYFHFLAGELIGSYKGAAEALRTFPLDARARMVAEVTCLGLTSYREVFPTPRPLASRYAA